MGWVGLKETLRTISSPPEKGREIGIKLATGLPGLDAQNIPANGVSMGTESFINLIESAGASQPSQLPPRGWHHTDPLAHPASVTLLRQISPDFHS